jgi:hypothetical protein
MKKEFCDVCGKEIHGGIDSQKEIFFQANPGVQINLARCCKNGNDICTPCLKALVIETIAKEL